MNPLAGIDVVRDSAPAFADLDGDGHLDLVVGDYFGSLAAFRNTGSGFEPFAVNPLAGIDAGYRSTPAFADLDRDGDLDLVVGSTYGTLTAYENAAAGWIPFASDPVAGVGVRYGSAPAFVDLDSDGDADLVLGSYYDGLAAFENTGSGWVRFAANPFAGLSVGRQSSPSFVDLDGDGDLDLVVSNNSGSVYGQLNAFENTAAGWVPFASNPFARIVEPLAKPAFADLDGDGTRELILGGSDGTLQVFEARPNRPPSVTSADGAQFQENALGIAYRATALDTEGDALTWSLSGDDAALFTIDAATGAVGFKAAPDFEAPADTGGDNVYDITVIVGDGEFTASLDVGITVTDRDEVPLRRFAPYIVDPLAGIGSIVTGKPTFVDLDGDSDLDLVVGNAGGTPFAYRNTGAGFVPFAVNPLADISTRYHNAPAFADLDGDGDLDVVVGQYDGTLASWENTGAGYVPFATNPFAGIAVGGGDPGIDPNAGRADPDFVDLDGDGDLDLVVGGKNGTISAFENTGSGFVAFAANPFAGIDVGSFAAPTFTDLDDDGDLDLVVGNSGGTLAAFENTGAGFVDFGARNPFATINVLFGFSNPAFGDLDGDGDADLVVAQFFGPLLAFKNSAPGDNTAPVLFPGTVAPFFENGTGLVYQATAADEEGDTLTWSLSGADAALFAIDAATGAVTFRTAPDFEARADADGDNVYDITVVVGDGALTDSVDVSIALVDRSELPLPTYAPFASDPFAGISVSSYSSPAFADLDGDGDLDMVLGQGSGRLSGYENTVARFTAFATDPFAGIGVSYFSTPAFADLDGDGDLDLVVGNYDGTLSAYENAAAGFAAFASNPFAGIDVGSHSAPAVADLDGDGDVDLVVGNAYGGLTAYENTGAGFVAFAANPLAGITVGFRSTVAFTDLDGDGDLDLVSGSYYGLAAYEKTSAGYVAFASPPLDGVTLTAFANRPAFADIDGDGDLDLIVGDPYGTLTAFAQDRAPVVTSAATASFAENGTGIAYQATATDPDGDTPTWSISGDDAALFDIDAATGAVRFKAAPDFEAPADTGGDNVYDLVVTAGDGRLAAGLAVSITVTDGVDVRIGKAGPDTLTGTAGPDSMNGAAGRDSVSGGTGADTLLGAGGNDTLAGGDGADSLNGGADGDELAGGLGADTLRGAAGPDMFYYGSAAEGGDRILGYNQAEDVIQVSASGFGGGLVKGQPAPFIANLTGLATSAPGVGQFVWEKDARVLWWDADGAGGAAAMPIVSFGSLVGGANGFAASEIVVA